MLYALLKPNYEYSDDRGKLVQLVREGYHQINYVKSKCGSVRGGHYHKQNIETFYIIKGKVDVQFMSTNEKAEHIFLPGDMFSVFPFVKHLFLYLEDTELIAMYDKGVELEGNSKDIYKEYE